jgi:hypothetical protein
VSVETTGEDFLMSLTICAELIVLATKFELVVAELREMSAIQVEFSTGASNSRIVVSSFNVKGTAIQTSQNMKKSRRNEQSEDVHLATAADMQKQSAALRGCAHTRANKTAKPESARKRATEEESAIDDFVALMAGSMVGSESSL